MGGTPETTTYVSATQLMASVPAAQVTNGATLSVAVSNGASSSATSAAPVNLVVDNPAPVLAPLSSSATIAGTAGGAVTFTGTGFVPSTTIDVNGSARPTRFLSATQVSATLSAADFSAAGNLSITAVNPTPGGGTSAVVALVVSNPPVGAITLSPSTLPVGSTAAATITVTGTGFVPASVVQVGGMARATTYVNGTTLTFTATVADQATAATLPVTVINPAPGGGTSAVANLSIGAFPATPVITNVGPATLFTGTPAASLTISGTGFTTSSVAQWNGANLATSSETYYNGTGFSLVLTATVPASDLTSAGTASITVNTPNASPATSNAVTVTIANPPVPTLTGISPNSGAIQTASAETLTGTGFTPATTVAVNGVIVPSTYVGPTGLTANFPAAVLATPGNQNVTVTTPAPGGGTSAAQVYTSYISLSNNDIVYNAVDGLLYASVPATAAGGIGNAVVGIDPTTGTIQRTIQVGTKPNKLALSSDGTQLFVGIDGAGAVAQINLAQGTVVNQFGLGGGTGIYNPPYTASYLAGVPGLPNSVAVATTSYIGAPGVSIYDSGVARSGVSVNHGAGPLSFGSSASTLYLGSSYIEALTVTPAGITNAVQLASPAAAPTTLQYDNRALYLSSGQVLNAANGALNGTFYYSVGNPAAGPVVSDSTLGKAFAALTPYSGADIDVFDETSFDLLGSIPLNGVGVQGYPTPFRDIVRWGQNGLALAPYPSVVNTSQGQIFIIQSSLVKNISAAPADLSLSLTAPATSTTGTTVSYAAKVTNSGPNAAAGASLSGSLDPSLIINSVTPSQGSCTSAVTFVCDLGTIGNGASATVTVSATPTNSGTLSALMYTSSSSYDPTASNNQATVSTTVTGALYGAQPSLSSLSPNAVQAGSEVFTLTVNGAGFNVTSTVSLGNTALATTFVSANQLTASVSAASIATYGWAAVTVSNGSPGGGVSSVLPLTIYDLVNVPATAIQFDPYGQSLYATIPSTATAITPNSIVAINPFKGSVGTPVAVGSEPNLLAETSDGNYLYIGLSGSDSLAKFDLLTQTVDATVPLTYSSGNIAALSLARVPGSDSTLAVGVGNSYDTFGILDVSGTTGTFRTNFSGGYEGQNPVFASPTELYAYDSQTSGAEFYRYNVDSNGLTLIDGTSLDGFGGYSGAFELEDGLVYGIGGGIINPGTTPPSQVQTLLLIDFYGSGVAGEGSGLAADPSLQKDFLLLQTLPVSRPTPWYATISLRIFRKLFSICLTV